MQEPSVLDYLKYRLMPWKYPPVTLPPPARPTPVQPEQETILEVWEEAVVEAPALAGEAAPAQAQDEATVTVLPATPAAPAAPAAPAEAEAVEITKAPEAEPKLQPEETPAAWPWRTLAAVVLALAGQRFLGPPTHAYAGGVFLLLAALGCLASAYLGHEFRPPAFAPHQRRAENYAIRSPGMLPGLVAAVVVFATSSNNHFGLINLGLLTISLGFLLRAFWVGGLLSLAGRPALAGLTTKLRQEEWQPRVTRWGLLVLGAALVVLYFRLAHLVSVPAEMVSDHAEKYLDVRDVLAGNTRIFFPRNGGREALQFYLLAALVRYFGQPMDFLTLKISTTLIGLAALPFVYLLGKEIANRRVGLLAFFLAGVAYWTNVVARAGMRLPFYMLFTAATLYFLARALRRSERNSFILAGISLGLSAYGYTADRLLPLTVLAAVGLYLLHPQSQGQRKETAWRTAILILFALVISLPLLRYMIQDPQGFTYRMFSRMGSIEQPLPAPAWQIFLSNFWNALKMFSVSAGVIWPVSIPNYPALGLVSGGLFYLGLGLALARWLRRRHWLDLFLIVAVPLLLLPSVLALAFPGENPNLYRTGGAMVPVFILAALALDGLMNTVEGRFPASLGRGLALALAAILLFGAARQEFGLVFGPYAEQYRLSAWNYSEVGRAIRDFSETIGSPDTAYVVGYPYWLDTRLVAIEAGYPDREYAVFTDGLPATQADPRPKLFVLNVQDAPDLQALQELYPTGRSQVYTSQTEGKDFLLYYAPPESPAETPDQ